MQQQSIWAARIGCRFRRLSLQKCSERFLMHIPVLPPIHHSPSSSRVTPHVRLIELATRGVMEILGLVPYQSQTQYLDEHLRAIGRGNKAATSFRFVSSLAPLFRNLLKKWIQRGSKLDTWLLFVSARISTLKGAI